MGCPCTFRGHSSLGLASTLLFMKTRLALLALLSFASSELPAQATRLLTLLKMGINEQRSDAGPTPLAYAVAVQAAFPAAAPAGLTVTLTKPNGTQVLPRTSPASFSTVDAFI